MGFLDPAEYVAPATQVVPGEKLKNDENVLDENKEEEEERGRGEGGADPILAKRSHGAFG